MTCGGQARRSSRPARSSRSGSTGSTQALLGDGLPGRLGLTHLPGKHGISSATPGSSTDATSDADLALLRGMGVGILLLLVEDHELALWGDPGIVAPGGWKRGSPSAGTPPRMVASSTALATMAGLLVELRHARAAIGRGDRVHGRRRTNGPGRGLRAGGGWSGAGRRDSDDPAAAPSRCGRDGGAAIDFVESYAAWVSGRGAGSGEIAGLVVLVVVLEGTWAF